MIEDGDYYLIESFNYFNYISSGDNDTIYVNLVNFFRKIIYINKFHQLEEEYRDTFPILFTFDIND